jgi:ABC-2 type transport system ATP-binding protein
MCLIEIESLTRFYGMCRGVEKVSLQVPQGALFGFLGPNGAGKTTTIRVMLGFLRPTSGTARIFGLDCWRESKEIKQDIGYLPGDLRLPSWMDGTTALSLFGAVRQRDLSEPGNALAARFDLDLTVKVRDMSRGMRQKLGLVLVLAHSPRLLVLDEPTSGLDPLMQQALREVLREGARNGQTIFFSSHSLPEVEELCDQVAIVRDGELVADESLKALRERAGHDVTIRWRHDSPSRAIEPPPFLKLARRHDTLWEGRLDGPVQPLLDFLAGKEVDDLHIGRPDLEGLFRRFYERKQGDSR